LSARFTFFSIIAHKKKKVYLFSGQEKRIFRISKRAQEARKREKNGKKEGGFARK
jgi:hypothetical protein